MAGSLIQVATELKSQAPAVGSVVMPGNNGVEQALASVSGEFASVADKVGKLADHAAQAEGREAGHLAGMDPEFRPTHNRTLRGDAYDQAGLQVAAARVKTEIAADLASAADKHPVSPGKLTEALASKAGVWREKMQQLPDLLPEVNQELTSRTFHHVREATRAHDAQVAQQQAAALQMRVHDSLRQISQEAYSGGLDETAIENLQQRYKALEKTTLATDLRGRPLIDPAARVKMLEHAKQEMASAQTFGAFDRLPSLTEKETYIKQFRQDFADGKGTSAAYDFQHFQQIEHRLQAQFAKDKAQAGVGLEMVAAKVRAVGADMEQGYPIAPDRMAGLNAQINMLGAGAKNEKLTEQLQQAQTNGAMIQRLQVLAPEEQAIHVAQMRADAKTRGAADGDTHAIAIADKLLTNTRAALKSDPLGWADRTGLLPVPRLDFSRTDIAEQFAERVARADQVARHFKLHLPGEAGSASAEDAPKIQYLYPEEKQQLGALMAQGGKSTLATAALIAQSPRAPQILAELGKHAPAMALVGQLTLDAPGGRPPQVAIDAANGFGLMKTEGHKSRLGKPTEIRDAADAVLGPALSRLPEPESAVIATANAAYEVRAHLQGKKDFDPKLYQKTLAEALGEKEIGGQKYGGVVYQKTGRFGGDRDPVVLPGNMRQGAFDSVRLAIRLEDLDAAPQITSLTTATAAGAGVSGLTTVDPADFRRAVLKTAGDGKYFMTLGDPDGPEPKFLLDGQGRKFVLDLKKLEPKLRDRLPSAYLGGG